MQTKQYYLEHELMPHLKDAHVRNENANSNADILQYYITSVKGMNAELDNDEIKSKGIYKLTGISFTTQYACVAIENNVGSYVSYYVRNNYRGQGIFKSLIKESKANNETIITTTACKLYDILVKYEANFILALSFYDFIKDCSSAEEFIASVYGNKRTKRSNVPMINHILEGCYVLKTLNINENDEASAYCLHPVFQDTSISLTSLVEYLSNCKDTTLSNIDTTQAAEYARVANSLLLNHFKEGGLVPNAIYRNPVVKNMLIADKIQNFKDFELYHADTHKESEDLTKYFKYWLESVSISTGIYSKIRLELMNAIQVEMNIEDLPELEPEHNTYGFKVGQILEIHTGSLSGKIKIIKVLDKACRFDVVKPANHGNLSPNQIFSFGSVYHENLAKHNKEIKLFEDTK